MRLRLNSNKQRRFWSILLFLLAWTSSLVLKVCLANNSNNYNIPTAPTISGFVVPTTTPTLYRHYKQRKHCRVDCHRLSPQRQRRRQRRHERSFQSLTALTAAAQSDTDHTESSRDYGRARRARGVAVLLTVPLAWGTYTPTVKYLYAIQPPVPGLVFSAAYYIVAAVALWVTLVVSLSSSSAQQEDNNNTHDNTHDNNESAFASSMTTTTTTSTTTTTGFLPWQAGWELGTYLFLANVVQVVGLQTVPADRAGFLVQLTTVIVPFMETAVTAGNLRRALPTRTWVACVLALAGVVVIDLDGNDDLIHTVTTAAIFHSETSTSSSSSNNNNPMLSLLQSVASGFTTGDCLILLAAVMYSLHVVRLERYAKESTALKLATSKATVEAFLSTGLVLGLMLASPPPLVGDSASSSSNTGLVEFASTASNDIATFFATISESVSSGAIPTSVLVPAVGAILWTGWVTCAYTIYAQSFGQSRVKPTDANLIYSVQPLFTALFAFVLLGETLGPAGVVGGSLIATAVYMVAMTDTTNSKLHTDTTTNDGPDAALSMVDSTTALLSEDIPVNGDASIEVVER